LNPACKDFDPERAREAEDRIRRDNERAGTPQALNAFSALPPDHGNYSRARLPADYETVGVVLENGNRYQLLDAGHPPPGTMYLTPEHEEAGADWRN